jgi:Nucleotidyl transferase AbiEii toxin, Type IV TA system
MTLPERLVALHRALARRRIPHAFGGAIALAYWTLDPRATSDIDVNIFLPAVDAPKALRALPPEVAQPDGTAEAIARDGQIRLWWNETPIDLFFDTVPVHHEAARHRARVAFARTRIPVLGPVELAVFKAMFDRTRDWADIEAMLAAESLDLDAVRETLQTMFPVDDHRFVRLDEALRRARAEVGVARRG